MMTSGRTACWALWSELEPVKNLECNSTESNAGKAVLLIWLYDSGHCSGTAQGSNLNTIKMIGPYACFLGILKGALKQFNARSQAQRIHGFMLKINTDIY